MEGKDDLWLKNRQALHGLPMAWIELNRGFLCGDVGLFRVVVLSLQSLGAIC